VAVAWGWRQVNEEHPAGRPIDCEEYGFGSPPTSFPYFYGGCEWDEEVTVGVSDLKVRAGAASSVAAGGRATVPFTLDFASTAEPPPSFSLTASSSLAGATAAPHPGTYAPANLDPETHRAPQAGIPVAVGVPATAAPGTYDVTLTATTSSGGSVSRTAKLTVTAAPAPLPAKPTIALGKVKLNRRKGTATVRVTVSEAGTLAVSGKTVRAVKRKATGPKSLKVTIRAKGRAKKALAKKGKAKVRAKFDFTALSGSTASRSRSLTLKRAKKHRTKQHRRRS
jgi:hypothetical protein